MLENVVSSAGERRGLLVLVEEPVLQVHRDRSLAETEQFHSAKAGGEGSARVFQGRRVGGDVHREKWEDRGESGSDGEVKVQHRHPVMQCVVQQGPHEEELGAEKLGVCVCGVQPRGVVWALGDAGGESEDHHCRGHGEISVVLLEEVRDLQVFESGVN